MRTCHHLWERMSIHWDGNVALCVGDIDGKHRLGNLGESSIKGAMERKGDFEDKGAPQEIGIRGNTPLPDLRLVKKLRFAKEVIVLRSLHDIKGLQRRMGLFVVRMRGLATRARGPALPPGRAD